jgi:hypothetical protein
LTGIEYGMSSSGGGSSIIAAYAVIGNAIRRGRAGRVDGARAALDAEELRAVEYASMGLPVPEQPHVSAGRSTIVGRLRSRLVAGLHHGE